MISKIKLAFLVCALAAQPQAFNGEIKLKTFGDLVMFMREMSPEYEFTLVYNNGKLLDWGWTRLNIVVQGWAIYARRAS